MKLFLQLLFPLANDLVCLCLQAPLLLEGILELLLGGKDLPVLQLKLRLRLFTQGFDHLAFGAEDRSRSGGQNILLPVEEKGKDEECSGNDDHDRPVDENG